MLCEGADELRHDLVHVTAAEGDDKIAGLSNISDEVGRLLPIGNERHSVWIDEPLTDEGSRHPRNGVLPGAVHVEHNGKVGVFLESAREFGGEVSRSTKEVGLVNGDDSTLTHNGSRGGQDGIDLGVVMGVIVVHAHA